MLDTAARLLALLSVLHSGRVWTGPELADRLGVSSRTIRNDIDRLRQLDYPVQATRGAVGGYRLGDGAGLPPLLLNEEEAVAVAIGLRAVCGIAGIEDSSALALAKLEQVLPVRLRATVSALGAVVDRAPENNGTDAPDPDVDPAVLAAIAAAIRSTEWFRFDLHGESQLVEPYRLLVWAGRWHMIGRDPGSGEWGTYRVDWITPRIPTRRRFSPVPIPGGDFTGFAMTSIAMSGYVVHARLRIAASAADVLARINPTVGMVEAVSETESVLLTGADTLDTIAAYIGMLGMDFTVESPHELRDVLRVYSQRYARAADI